MGKKRTWYWVTRNVDGWVDVWRYKNPPKKDVWSGWGQWMGNNSGFGLSLPPEDFRSMFGITVPPDRPVKVEFTAKVVE